MDLKQIEQLIELMRKSGVMQLSLELPDYKVSITRDAGGEEATTVAPSATGVAAAGSEPGGQAQPATRVEASPALPVSSPVVGVFYNGGTSDRREMIKEGDRVQAGQLLAAIEAMKVPNELRAPVNGVVAKLLAQDGQPVEYGQTLFLIAPEEAGESGDGDALVGMA